MGLAALRSAEAMTKAVRWSRTWLGFHEQSRGGGWGGERTPLEMTTTSKRSSRRSASQTNFPMLPTAARAMVWREGAMMLTIAAPLARNTMLVGMMI